MVHSTPGPTPPDGLFALVQRTLGDQYDLLGEIGRGAMGVVYRAKDRTLLRTVAIKVLPPAATFAPGAKERFLREARIVANLSHSNIVDVYTVEEADPLVFFVMRFIEGETLEQHIASNGPLDFATARTMLTEVARALAYAHGQKVIHRDIKPENILIDRDGRPMITDFGVARALADGSAQVTAAGSTFGTPLYMSPEQAQGDRNLDGRTDLYALGVVAYQMLTGEVPFPGSDRQAVFIQHLCVPPAPVSDHRPDVPPGLERIVMTLLAKNRTKRFASATAVVTELGHAFDAPADGRIMSLPPAHAIQPSRTKAPALRPDQATPEELARWDHPRVRAFRRQLIWHGWAIAGILAVRLVSHIGLWDLAAVVWTFSLCGQAARFQLAGFGWRDLLRKSRPRALESPAPQPVQRRGLSATERAVLSAGRYGPQIRAAAAERDIIIGIVRGMTPAQRAAVPGVEEIARRLVLTMQAIAGSLAELERAPSSGGANERTTLEAKVDECASALETIKLDMLRLAAGSLEATGVTTLTTQAMTLAQEIDAVLYAVAELRRDGL